MSRVRLLPYRVGSRSARSLANALEIKRLRLTNSRFRPRPGDVIINWGNSTPMWWPWTNVINPHSAVKNARDKLYAYHIMHAKGVTVPPFTQIPENARNWLWDDIPVMSRYTTTGQGGAGIVYYDGRKDYDRFIHDRRAPLYVRYVPKKHEYRVHVVRGEVIDVQQKRTRSGTTGNCHKVRNSANGWVFCREDVNPPELVTSQAVQAVAALGLDFGAVDIGWTEKNSTATVYEVNTAPGLEGTTLDRYSTALDQIIRGVV